MKRNFDRIINIGCAEGFYAVGFARRFPNATVLAYDIEPIERSRCKTMARINFVGDRVIVKGRCDHEELHSVITNQSLVICDIEGAEKTLLDLQKVGNLSKAVILVEIHDLYDPTIGETLVDRFCDTHEICLVNSVKKSMKRVNEVLPSMSFEMLEVIEGRGVSMQWALMVPVHEISSYSNS